MTVQAMPTVSPERTDIAALATLGVAMLWLAIEPMLRVLLWGAAAGSDRLLSNDAHWLALAMSLLLIGPARAELRRVVAAHPWLVLLGLTWAAGALLPLLFGDGAAVAARWPVYLMLGLGVLGALRLQSDVGRHLLVAAAAGFLGLALALALFVATEPLPPTFDWVTQLPGALNVRSFGYEAVIVATIGSLYRPTGPVAATVLLRAAAVAAWALIFWSGGRGALLAAVVAVAVILLAAAPGGRRRQLLVALAVVAVGALLSLLHTPPSGSFGFWRTIGFATAAAGGSGAVDVSSGRLAIWAESLQFIAAHPWIGIGEGAMKTLLLSAARTYPQPHNVFLQAPLAWGIPAGAAFLIAAAWPLHRIRRRLARRTAIGAPATAAAAAVVALAVHAIYDGTLFHSRPVVMFLIMAAIALTAPIFDKGRPAP